MRKIQIKVKLLVASIATTLLLSACTAEPEEKMTLYVQAHEPDFMQTYGFPYEAEHGNIEIVGLSEGYSGEHEPDVLVLNASTIMEALNEQQLAPLDPFNEQDRLFFENIPLEQKKGVEILREVSSDYLYGLPMSVSSFALYYNVDLFDEYDVPYPTDYMSWEDIFELAQQFPTTDQTGASLYGLSHDPNFLYPHLHYLSRLYRFSTEDSMYGLIHWSEDDIGIKVDDDDLIQRWSNMVPLLKSGHLRLELEEDEPHALYHGNVAMVEGTIELALSISSTSQAPINWEVVTYPSAYDRSGYHYNYSAVYGISEHSDKKEAAWDFIKYVSENREIFEEIDGRSIEAHYLLEHDPDSIPESINYPMFGRLSRVVSSKLDEVLEGDMEMREVFEAMQAEIEPLVDAFLQGEELPPPL